MNERIQRIRNEQSTVIPSQGGFLTNEEPTNELLSAMKEFGGMREAATVFSTATGNIIPWPTTDRTANKGSIVGQNKSVGAATARTFGTVNIGAHMYTSGSIAIPFQLLQDSGIDVEAEVVGGLAESLQRGQNEDFTLASGNAEPRGIVPAASLGKTGAAGQTTTATFDDLIDMEHAVDPAYRRQGCQWMFHDTTLKMLKKIKDGEGRPIWLPDYAAANVPAQLMGYAYVINQDMAVMAASAKSMLFGNLKKYRIRDVMGYLLFRMTDSAYTLLGQVGFVAFLRSDGNFIAADNTCVVYYINAAS
jgi:HK97 family phage major capsid protein